MCLTRRAHVTVGVSRIRAEDTGRRRQRTSSLTHGGRSSAQVSFPWGRRQDGVQAAHAAGVQRSGGHRTHLPRQVGGSLILSQGRLTPLGRLPQTPPEKAWKERQGSAEANPVRCTGAGGRRSGAPGTASGCVAPSGCTWRGLASALKCPLRVPGSIWRQVWKHHFKKLKKVIQQMFTECFHVPGTRDTAVNRTKFLTSRCFH